MAKYHVLKNNVAGGGWNEEKAVKLEKALEGNEITYDDIMEIGSYEDFFAGISPDDKVLIAGGDGTLCRFVNDTLGIKYPNEIYYFASGTGNDFLHDIEANPDVPVLINQYIKDLPVAEINGKKYKFINGIGFGIDGYCCEEGDKRREKGSKKINYTAIALKGLAYDYKRTNAKITVDGEVHNFKKVWLVPTMNGRYYGGGMMATPTQDRLNGEHTVTVSPMYGGSKLKTLLVFPSIFEGKHIEHKEMVSIFSGHEIEVEFDRPTALQIDGETVTNVTKYKVYANDEARSATTL